MKELEEKIRGLSSGLRHEVEEFVESLLARRPEKPPAALRLEWAGALGDWRGRYTSVELQHAVSAWRSAGS